MPSITVLIPVYNGARYLDAAIESVRNQTFTDIEILVIDDGSTDDSGAIVQRHCLVDDRVRLVSQPNSGVCAARNLGLRLASASWVALLDADDIALPLRLEMQWNYLKDHSSVVALGTYGWRIGEMGNIIGAFDVGPTSAEELLQQRVECQPTYLLNSSVIVSREAALALGGFRKDYEVAEDLDMWTRLADRHLVLAIPERLVYYRVHSQSASTMRFFHQLEVTAWIEENTRRRRSGQSELTFGEVRSVRQGEPLRQRIKRFLASRSQYLYRRAGGLLANNNVAGLLWLTLSFLIWPPTPIGRLRKQILPVLFDRPGNLTRASIRRK